MKKHLHFTALLVTPLIIIISTHTLAFQSVTEAFSKILANSLPALFEYLLFLSLALLFYGLSGLTSVAFAAPSVSATILTLISYYKEAINGTPLILSDIGFAGNLGELAGFVLPNLSFSALTILSVTAQLAFLALLIFLDRKYRIKKISKRIIPLTAGIILSIALILPPTFRLCRNICREYPSPEERAENYSTVAGLYFTYTHNKAVNFNPTEKEIEALKSEVEIALAAREEKAEPEILPNVIFLMSEAFFDVTELPDVTFSNDPLENFHRLSENCTSGKFISTTYSGGTGYVEAELLTGFCSNLLKGSNTLTSLPDDSAYERIPVITDVFKNYGYSTTFLHSYNSELYNRQKMYSGFGFDNIFFDDSFPENVTRYNTLISDIDLTNKIIELLENKDNRPLFMFAVSMENHYPYIPGKYPAQSEIKVSSDKLNEEEKSTLGTLATGIYGADKALGELVSYLEKQEEPYMLVFFGDHLPNLTTQNSSSIYTSLGLVPSNVTSEWTTKELYCMMQTDYLVWTNYEEKETFPGKEEGATFFGLNILKRLGFTLSDFYQYLDYSVSKNLTLCRTRLFVKKNGELWGKIPEDATQMMANYKTAIRDIIYAKNEVFGE